jgi:hypothetical protein
LSLTEEEQKVLYEVFCERYDKSSTVITSKRDFGEWPSVLINPLMSSAAMDRDGQIRCCTKPLRGEFL